MFRSDIALLTECRSMGNLAAHYLRLHRELAVLLVAKFGRKQDKVVRELSGLRQQFVEALQDATLAVKHGKRAVPQLRYLRLIKRRIADLEQLFLQRDVRKPSWSSSVLSLSQRARRINVTHPAVAPPLPA